MEIFLAWKRFEDSRDRDKSSTYRDVEYSSYRESTVVIFYSLIKVTGCPKDLKKLSKRAFLTFVLGNMENSLVLRLERAGFFNFWNWKTLIVFDSIKCKTERISDLLITGHSPTTKNLLKWKIFLPLVPTIVAWGDIELCNFLRIIFHSLIRTLYSLILLCFYIF